MKVCGAEGAPEAVVADVGAVGGEVAAEGAGEERRVLRDECHCPPQLRKAQAGDVEAVDPHCAAAKLR